MASTNLPTEKDLKPVDPPATDTGIEPEVPPKPTDPPVPSEHVPAMKDNQQASSCPDTKESDLIPTTGSDHLPITDLIINDHDEARNLHEDYLKATDIKEKKRLRNQLVKVLVLHDECEQVTAYPLLRDKVPGDESKKEYERSLDEHQQLRTLLHEVRYADMENDPEFDSKLKKAMDTAFKHIDTEEQKVLPMMKENIDQKQLLEAGDSYINHKKMATTRPHPHAPQQGIAAEAANIIMGPFDKLRDTFYQDDAD
ncbi:hypothetical protein A0J61_10605 [Choanephora cucurbitarum]|uniref:Hemerythrin-like domain-containing protein n=1 Tax=Choanephora cucurbitarum TaxID=101091 RepID=A0A1C7MY65_9FUNG|nr:hypothetical protein A0J61_10605 [Choanephora cucurbitarum]